MFNYLGFYMSRVKTSLLVIFLTFYVFQYAASDLRKTVNVDQSKTYSGEPNSFQPYTISLPSGKHIQDVSGCRVWVYGYCSDEENYWPYVGMKKTNGNLNHHGWINGTSWGWYGGFSFSVQNGRSEWLRNSGSNNAYVEVGVWVKDETGDDSDLETRTARVEWSFKYPKLNPDRSIIDLGTLYPHSVPGASTYNDQQKSTFKLENNGDNDTELSWSITAPSFISVSATRGKLKKGASVDLTVTAQPIAVGNFDSQITIEAVATGSKTTLQSSTILVTASVADRPPAPTKSSSDTIHVAAGDSQAVMINKVIGSIGRYEWQQTGANQSPTPDSNWDNSRQQLQKSYSWNDPGEFDVHARAVSTEGIAGHSVAIRVRVWNRPEINATASDLPSWKNNMYVGIVNTEMKLKAEATFMVDGIDQSSDRKIGIQHFSWDFDNLTRWTPEDNVIQEYNTSITKIWGEPISSRKIRCKAITTNGVASEVQEFTLKIYDTPQLDVGGSGGKYTGRPNKTVYLKGLTPERAYPGATFRYQWTTDTGENIETETATGTGEYTWTSEGTYEVSFHVTVTTSEGLTVHGTKQATVVLSAGQPTAILNGPYIGGIHGGNFSPVQLRGNHPEYVEDEEVGLIEHWEWANPDPTDQDVRSFSDNTIWNPTQAYDRAGTYQVSLIVESEYGKSSSQKGNTTADITTVTIIAGKIKGQVKAADLRTPVKDVQITLTSSHVDSLVLQSIAVNTPDIEDGGIFEGNRLLYTFTDEAGKYKFENLPLGSYSLTASKFEDSTNMEHEFEVKTVLQELTLDSPNGLAVDFVDLSVFPVGGQVYYSIRKNGEKVLVDNVKITASPIGSVSPVSTYTEPTLNNNQNYSLPLFSGEYTFLPDLTGHSGSIKVIGHGGNGSVVDLDLVPDGYNSATSVFTIEGARTDLDFIDYTSHEIVVVVEDSGGFSIELYQRERIQVLITGKNGEQIGQVTNHDGTSRFTTFLPPGSYTVSLPYVPTARVKGLQLKEAQVSLTNNSQLPHATMVVPVPIELTIENVPKLLDIDNIDERDIPGSTPEEFLETLASGLISVTDDLEGYMIYYPTAPQEHTYVLKARANGRPVTDFNLIVTDGITDWSTNTIPTTTYSGANSGDGRFASVEGDGLEDFYVTYKITAGKPRTSVVQENDTSTYEEVTVSGGRTEKIKIPKVLPKKIRFRATKNGYEDSEPVPSEVTVLGDVRTGEASNIVSVPEINYMVLHDPPGDGSYSYIEDSMRIKGMIEDVHMKVNDTYIPVYPSPWSVERQIDDIDFSEFKTTEENEDIASRSTKDRDLGNKGLLGYRDSDPTLGHFTYAAAAEGAFGVAVQAYGFSGYVVHLLKIGATAVGLSAGELVQYQVSPNRTIETPSEDEIPDLMGPGKGDVYYGEGWTVGLQKKYRYGLRFQDDKWQTYADEILTYDILERHNQYVYTIRDIEQIISDLEVQAGRGQEVDTEMVSEGEELNPERSTGGEEISPEVRQQETTKGKKIEQSYRIWKSLLERNPAYEWQRKYVEGKGLFSDKNSGNKAGRAELTEFLKIHFPEQDNGTNAGELMMFSGGAKFDYSRSVTESNLVQFSTDVSVSTGSEGGTKWEVGFDGPSLFGMRTKTSYLVEGELKSAVGSNQSFGSSWESGTESEQNVGFVLSDNDVGDNISTYVYQGPWGTPIFFTDPGSITSDPWQKGTNKAIDFELELVEEPDNIGPFDYKEGAHYRVRVSYTGVRELETATVDSVIYDYPFLNQQGMTVLSNGSRSPYVLAHSKSEPSIVVEISLYPPAIDQDNTEEQEYSVGIEVDSVTDPSQINRILTLKPRFADLRSPRATIISPYDGQRISPELFSTDNPFKLELFSDDEDLSQVQLQYRSKRQDGIWGSWIFLSDLFRSNGDLSDGVRLVKHTDRSPQRQEFTYSWTQEQIKSLGVGEYALRAVASDKATKLEADGSQISRPNTDLDAPIVTFAVDGSKPTVLTSKPFYQDPDNARIYVDELSVTFNDDMRADDFSDRTFLVSDLMDDNKKLAGFVSYSPALRKAIFVPVVPFRSYGFFHVLIKTDTKKFDSEGNLESTDFGLHDLAGNPLDNEFSFTFRTKGSVSEETWQLNFSVTDGEGTDSNNIAAVSIGSQDFEDGSDARAVPRLTPQLSFSFLLSNSGTSISPSSNLDMTFYRNTPIELDRDVRPADGRLSHHWFFVVDNAQFDSDVIINYRPSSALKRTKRQYPLLRLVDYGPTPNLLNSSTPSYDITFDSSDGGNPKKITYPNVIQLNPSQAEVDLATGQTKEVLAYRYRNAGDVNGVSRYFRLDVQKANMEVGNITRGSSGWVFFSVPIKPQNTDPAVNLADDIGSDNSPFKLFSYNSDLKSYKIYPLDLGQVSLQDGHAYFVRLEADNIDIDVGGTINRKDKVLSLKKAGWHAIGNPFPVAVDTNSLKFATGTDPSDEKDFTSASDAGLIEPNLYSWRTGIADPDQYQAVTVSGQLEPWFGYWLRTLKDDVSLTIPVPVIDEKYSPIPPDNFVTTLVAPASTPPGFTLNFSLTSETSADTSTLLGTHPDAKIDWDRMDQSEPPRLKNTVAAYFDHIDWEIESINQEKNRLDSKKKDTGLKRIRYNSDFQPILQIGQSRNWDLVTYTDQQTKMELSWVDSIDRLPDDTMFYLRRKPFDNTSSNARPKGQLLTSTSDIGKDGWLDMRKLQAIDIEASKRINTSIFEIQAERFEMMLPTDIEIIGGEAEVKISWSMAYNPFISDISVMRKVVSNPNNSMISSQYNRSSEDLVTYHLNADDIEFIDTQVEEEVTYDYWIKVAFKSGSKLKSETIKTTVLAKIEATRLMPNYPNPFNPETWFPYELDEDTAVTFEIHNSNGMMIRRLEIGMKGRGRYQDKNKAAYWDGRTELGEPVASGVYFYTMIAGEFIDSQKMVILK
ncbi:hypothetical protein CMK18_15740 [Candidatus Poribacteria bacterium]|nr:hypothetical protein [Candidatus Poribacteria bacterium]